MRIIPASFQIEERNEIRGGIENIERAGRTCYKSEDKARCVCKISDFANAVSPQAKPDASGIENPGSSAFGMGKGDTFVKALITRHHEAMLEHGDYIFIVDDEHIWDNVFEALMIARETRGVAPMIEMTNIGHRPIISGNIRAWRELIESTAAGAYFSGIVDPLYTQDIRERLGACFMDEADPRIHRIFYMDLQGECEMLTHRRQTVRFIVDRSVSHELVRHRLFSFAQESTRYCNYSQDKFGNQITVIEPCYLSRGTEPYRKWEAYCNYAEEGYFELLNAGLLPQEARAVLPNSLKTEIVVTGNLREWKHFFDLRALEKTGPVHPQMAEIAKPLYIEYQHMHPDIFTEELQ